MISLQQIKFALVSLGVDKSEVNEAIHTLQGLLAKLDEVEVKGRQNVDTLLGCMMAIEAIIGKDGGEVNG